MLHAGFQLTVTVLVYPALRDAHRTAPDAWTARHDRHSRAIVPLVGLVYVALGAAGVWVLAAGPGVLDGLALAAAAGAVAVTALAAAPLHGRLGAATPADRDALLTRLLLVDRGRATFAVAGAALAVLALVPR